jgi:tetratricopeptide repeat protein/methyltransferase family protein
MESRPPGGALNASSFPPGGGESPIDNAGELAAYARHLGVAELALLAQHYLAQGQPEAVLVLASERAFEGIALGLCESRALLALGQFAAALARVDRLLAEEPGHPLSSYYKAQILAQTGDVKQAATVLHQLIGTSPDFPGALAALARLTFPGPPYKDALARIHALLQPSVYLEIGVEHGATLSLAEHSALAIGIDPGSHAIRHPLPRGARLFRETSDDFFGRRTQLGVLGQRGIDFAFIDGMHRFENVLRDFAHVERWSTAKTVIALHDCLPVAPSAALRERRSRFWVGDCWKAVECLLAHRPDLELSTLPCHPSGLVLIRKLDPASRVLSEALPELEREYRSKPYPYPPGAWPSAYRIVENTDAGLMRALGIPPSTRPGRP